MTKSKFYTRYGTLPPKQVFTPDTETCFVSQSEVKTSGLSYQLKQYGFDTLAQKMEDLRSKFGYADCTTVSDFTSSMNKYVQGVEYFNALPSELRRKYNDKPELFYEDVQKNPETAYKGGFISEDFYKELKNKYNGDLVNHVDTSLSNIVEDNNSQSMQEQAAP